MVYGDTSDEELCMGVCVRAPALCCFQQTKCLRCALKEEEKSSGVMKFHIKRLC